MDKEVALVVFILQTQLIYLASKERIEPELLASMFSSFL